MNTPPPAPNPGNQPPAPVPAPPSPQPQAGGGRGGNTGGGGPRPPQLQQPPAPQGQVQLSDADVNRIADRLRATILPTQPSAQTPPDRTSNARQSLGFTFSDLLKWILMILLILVAAKFLWSWDFSPRTEPVREVEAVPKAASIPQALAVPEDPLGGVNPGAASVEDPVDLGRIGNTKHVSRNVEPPQVKALLDSGIHAVLVRSTNKVWSRRPGPYGKGQVTAVP